MSYNQKNFRYYYWFFFEFIKKNILLIIISFFITAVILVSITSLAPQINNLLFPRQTTIGLIGAYDETNLPDEITKKITNSLLYLNDKGEYMPALANQWEITDNGLIYKFYIKKDLTWNDGQTFTAKDINFKFKDIETVISDPYIIEFRLKKPLPIFLNYLIKPVLKSSLVGVAGFYKVGQYNIKNGNLTSILLIPSKNHSSRVTYRFYQNEKQLISAYKLGEINEMTVYRRSLADTFNSWPSTSIIKSTDYSKLLTLFININKPLLKEKEIRSAIALSIDRKLLENDGYEANGPIPPVSWAHNPELKKNVFDKEAAIDIVKKYQTVTKSAELTINTFFEYSDIADQVGDFLSGINLSTQINVGPNFDVNKYDLFLAFWNVPSDPDQYYFWHSTQTKSNISHYNNVKIDKLLEDGRNTSKLDERKKIYLEFQKVIVDDNPAIFLYYPYVYTIKRK